MGEKNDQFIFIRVKISEAKTEDGMASILELLQTETSDGALYQCKAGNPYGADVYSVYLTILGKNIHTNTLSLSFVIGIHLQYEMTYQTNILILSIVIFSISLKG